jgi:hypothetical protein
MKSFRVSSGRYSTKKNTFVASYLTQIAIIQYDYWLIPLGRWPKEAETCRRFTSYIYILYMSLYLNIGAVVGIYMVT